MDKHLCVRSHILIGLLLTAAVFGIFRHSIKNDFVNFDDDKYVTCNTHVQAGLTKESVSWALTSVDAKNWHPLTWLSHMLDIQVYGSNPAGHHLTNVLLHVLNTLLLFLALNRMTGHVWRGAFVAALFGVHPLHVESVAWVAERKDVLSAFFWMLTMLAYVRYVEMPKPGRYPLVLLSFALGLMAKPMLVTLPFVLLLLDYWPLDRLKLHSWWKLVVEKTPLFVFAAASSIVTYIVQSKGGAIGILEHLSLGARISNAVVSYMDYIGKMFWPRNLAVFYPYPVHGPPIWEIVGAGAALVCVSILVIRAGGRRPYLPVGWLWYLGTLVPVIGLVQVGRQAMADRYSYVPLIGLFIIVAWGVPDLASRKRWILAVAAGPALSALMLCTWFQVGVWRNNITFFEHALASTSDNYVAQNNLASIFAENPDPKVRDAARAIRLAEEACRLTSYKIPESLDTLAAAYAEAGRYEEAAAIARKALKLALMEKRDQLAKEIRERLRLYEAGRPYRYGATTFDKE